MGNDFVATPGWFDRWRNRKNIVYGKIHGKKSDANLTVVDNWLIGESPKLLIKFVFVNVESEAPTTQESSTGERFGEWMSIDEHTQTCEELTEEALCSRNALVNPYSVSVT
ncbi:hypothetical protein QAD02_011900 [Eretmocerus hayati]|uniref:Uncharacterized protein n=1 Tax=Eretmocerus hayati TaxID=131215 RepID=A0ACC2P0R9_9HYME|nr:hypothetical protein QAD02_011900 [Eretmocerus hayati]